MSEMNEKKVSAKRVFALAIKFLRKHLLDEFKSRNIGVDKKLIKWVMTVPAIWNDACKQFMREAAEKAGISGEKFSIVYEPEAASIYARLLPVDKFVGENKTTILKTFDPEKRFIVLDAGGGTVDISTQEVLTDGHLKIIHKVCGGSWGGELVNQEYRKLLKKLVGGDVLAEFKQTQGLDYIEMMRHFETKKRSYNPIDTSKVATRFPGSLAVILESMTGCNISDILVNSPLKDKLTVNRDKLFIARDLFESFYKESVSLTIQEIQEVLQDERCRTVSAVMLVGGFSECSILQNAIKKSLDLEVFIPSEGGLSVLKGAVIYGHDPNIISSRICNYTYGVSVSLPFNSEIHPREKYYRYDNEDWCKHVFKVCYEEGQEVRVGDIEIIELNNTLESEEAQRTRNQPFTVEIYISDKKKPTFVTEEGCKRHAKIYVDPPDGGWHIHSFGWVELEIAGTEMIGTYVMADSGKRISTRFEFLPSGYKNLKGELSRLSELD